MRIPDSGEFLRIKCFRPGFYGTLSQETVGQWIAEPSQLPQMESTTHGQETTLPGKTSIVRLGKYDDLMLKFNTQQKWHVKTHGKTQ